MADSPVAVGPPVVVGADGSEESLQAVEWAAREAARRAAPLRLVSVAPAPAGTVPSGSGPGAVAEVLREVYADALRMAARHAALLVPGLCVETGLLSGSPGRALARAAGGAAMLVVGCCGVGGYAGGGAGPVSRYAAGHAECPVVVVPAPGRAPHGEITVGVRDAGDAAAALGFAFREAALRGAGLRAVHAWFWFPPALAPATVPGGNFGAGTAQQRAGAAGTAAARCLPDPRALSGAAAVRLAEVLEGWRSRYPDVRVSQEVIHGHPARVLSALSARADLLVLGRHGPPDGVPPGIASVHYAVLSHARGPVAVVPA